MYGREGWECDTDVTCPVLDSRSIQVRHPELVSGSLVVRECSIFCQEMLKQLQHDEPCSELDSGLFQGLLSCVINFLF